MKKLVLFAALVAVAFVAAPASASVQNIKVSGAIDTTYLFREDFDFGLASSGSTIQQIFFTQTQVGVHADLTDNVSATVELINERVWENDPGSNSEVDLNLAFVTLREMLYSPLTVVVGRQNFSYGNSFVVNSAGTNNTISGSSSLSSVGAEDLSKETAQDAVRLIFDYNPLTLEFLYSKIHPNTVTSGVGDNDDNDLYGANATWSVGDDLNTTVETYFFAKYDRSSQGDASAVGKVDTIYTPGIRVSTNILDGLNVQAEFAHQSGTRARSATANDQQMRNANAAQFISNYSIPVLEDYKPVASYVYTWLSGDNDVSNAGAVPAEASGGETGEYWTAWDPMFENQGSGTIYNSLFDLTNLHIHSVSLQLNPMEDVTTKFSWHKLYMDEKLTGSHTGSNATLVRNPTDGSSGFQTLSTEAGESNLGQEFDWETTYDYTEDVQFGMNIGFFAPGSVFLGATNGDAAKQLILHGNVNF
jgi:hypothetical protein